MLDDVLQRLYKFFKENRYWQPTFNCIFASKNSYEIDFVKRMWYDGIPLDIHARILIYNDRIIIDFHVEPSRILFVYHFVYKPILKYLIEITDKIMIYKKERNPILPPKSQIYYYLKYFLLPIVKIFGKAYYKVEGFLRKMGKIRRAKTSS